MQENRKKLTIPAYVQETLQALEKAGHQAYCVGGCVRDSLLGRVPGDWDVTTSALPEETMAVFGEKAVPTGLKHGTVTVCWPEGKVETTTFRRDGAYTDHRHPVQVTFTASLTEDLTRRDFTVNAMAADLRGTLYDPFGGRADLETGILRCVGQPERRFSEDALRILRCLRFASVLGFAIEPATGAALTDCRELLRDIAPERICEELTKLLCGSDAAAVLRQYPEAAGAALPEILPMVGFDQRNIHHCYDLYTHIVLSVDGVAAEPVLRWTMLLHDIGKVNTFTEDERGQMHFYGHPKVSAAMAEDICTRLRMRKKDREDIVTLIAWHDRDIPVTEKGIGSAVRALGEENFRRLLAVKRADNRAQAPEYRWVCQKIDRAEEILEELLRKKQCLCLKDLAVNGNDLLALGYEGREIGAALEWLLEGVIAGEIDNKRDALLAALAKKNLLLP